MLREIFDREDVIEHELTLPRHIIQIVVLSQSQAIVREDQMEMLNLLGNMFQKVLGALRQVHYQAFMLLEVSLYVSQKDVLIWEVLHEFINE